MSAAPAPNACGPAHLRWRQIWRAAFPGLERPCESHSGIKGGISGDTVRCERPDEFRAGRHRSRDLFRKSEDSMIMARGSRERECRRATLKSRLASLRSNRRGKTLRSSASARRFIRRWKPRRFSSRNTRFRPS